MNEITYLKSRTKAIVAIVGVISLLYIVLCVFTSKLDSNYYLNTVIKFNRDLIDFNPAALVSENLIEEAIVKESLDLTAADFIPGYSVTRGFSLINEQIQKLMQQMVSEVGAADQNSIAAIRKRYENLIASQSNYYTIHYNLYKSPIGEESAKQLTHKLVDLFNEKFAAGLILNNPVLNQIDEEEFQLFDEPNAYSINAFIGLMTSIQQKNNKLQEVNFSKNGYNPSLINSRLKSLDFGVRQIIAAQPTNSQYFVEITQRDLNIIKNKIKSLNEVLGTISKEQKSLDGFSLSNNSDGKISAEYNSALLDKFLNLGATVSLVEFQQDLLKQKLSLENQRITLEQRLMEYSKNYNKAENTLPSFEDLVIEARTITKQINGYVKDYNEDFQKQIITILTTSTVKSAGLFDFKILLGIVFISFILAVMGFYLDYVFKNYEPPVN